MYTMHMYIDAIVPIFRTFVYRFVEMFQGLSQVEPIRASSSMEGTNAAVTIYERLGFPRRW